ncbi:hypothetical protein FRX31_026516 [Thalictrum thalictroides]|uniref:Zinc knuckle CX2CX4HX4C domain-containing protein n=1 Tax=Thalictrum thalictroides TaxID=46969 RepID=A0A7J6VI52_THATH|nr:hypothetical protein FRX31_026516 [Thalictrum thalictroides]
MDKATEKRTSLTFARICVDIDATKDLIQSHGIRLRDNKTIQVEFEYDWKPMICTSCQIFGHNTLKCKPQPAVGKSITNKGEWKKQKRRWVQKQNPETVKDNHNEREAPKSPAATKENGKLVKLNSSTKSTNRYSILANAGNLENVNEPNDDTARDIPSTSSNQNEMNSGDENLITESVNTTSESESDDDDIQSSDDEGGLEDGVADQLHKHKAAIEQCSKQKLMETSQSRILTRNAVKGVTGKEIPTKQQRNGRGANVKVKQ